MPGLQHLSLNCEIPRELNQPVCIVSKQVDNWQLSPLSFRCSQTLTYSRHALLVHLPCPQTCVHDICAVSGHNVFSVFDALSVSWAENHNWLKPPLSPYRVIGRVLQHMLARFLILVKRYWPKQHQWPALRQTGASFSPLRGGLCPLEHVERKEDSTIPGSQQGLLDEVAFVGPTVWGITD